MCVAMYELLTALLALELALPEEEIKNTYVRRNINCEVFKSVNCFMSLRKCHLN